MQFNKQKMELVRIGIGMLCSVPCCLAACAISVLRMNPGMSVYWLTPQYILLGVTTGLCGDGFRSLFKTQSFESLLSFGPPFGELARGVGEFTSIAFILVFSNAPFKWIQKDIEHNRLDIYYLFMAGLSVRNVVIYCLVGWWYREDAFPVGDREIDIIDELIHGVASGSVELQDGFLMGDEEMGFSDGLIEGVASVSVELQDAFPVGDEEMGLIEGLQDAFPVAYKIYNNDVIFV